MNFNVIVGSITSSIKYNNLNEGIAIPTNINAGVIVHISSIIVPWFKYFDLNLFLLSLNLIIIELNIQHINTNIINK